MRAGSLMFSMSLTVQKVSSRHFLGHVVASPGVALVALAPLLGVLGVTSVGLQRPVDLAL